MKEIKNILICGAGMMGKNIGYVFASNPSFQVGMYDLYPTDVEAGIRTNTRQLLDKGVITEQELSDRLSRISFTNDIDSDLVKNADLVIEAVFEDMKIKRDIFAKLEARCRPDTNSSVMSPSEISAELKHRERFVGTHFWNPGHLIPLVEVVKSDASSDEVAQTVMEVLRSVGKKPVLCRKDVPGFIANRMQHALWREAISIVEKPEFRIPEKFACFYGQNDNGETIYFYAIYHAENFMKDTNPKSYYQGYVEVFGKEAADKMVESSIKRTEAERWEIMSFTPQKNETKKFEYAREHSDDGTFFILTRENTYPHICFFKDKKPYYCWGANQDELSMEPLENYLKP